MPAEFHLFLELRFSSVVRPQRAIKQNLVRRDNRCDSVSYVAYNTGGNCSINLTTFATFYQAQLVNFFDNVSQVDCQKWITKLKQFMLS